MRSSVAMGLMALAGAGLAASIAGCGSDPAPGGDGIEGDVQEFGTGPKLAFDEYTVLFTNPICERYDYSEDQAVVSRSGERLTSKPKDAFCTPLDAEASGARDSSPQHKLIEWIDDPETNEIFFAYLSFSNKAVADALCSAVRDRSVKITMVLDRESDLETANRVVACEPGNADPDAKPRLFLRGHDGTIALAHNKVFLINPRSERPRIVFSSGNLSSGAVLHHENWHFVRVPARTHFAKAHVCLMDGMLEHYRTKSEYGQFIQGCRDGAGIGEESDIKTFFVPGDGGRAGQAIREAVRGSSSIAIAAHHFTYRSLRRELDTRLGGAEPPDVKLVVDDDLWWAGQGETDVSNNAQEYEMLVPLVEKGLQVRYMETNNEAHLLHHNKFIVFEKPDGDAVFTGAGNLSGSAFTDNFENFYYITIPEVVGAMKRQHEHLFSLATAPGDLPSEDVSPPTN